MQQNKILFAVLNKHVQNKAIQGSTIIKTHKSYYLKLNVNEI